MHSAVDAKLDAICANLAEMQKQGKTEKGARSAKKSKQGPNQEAKPEPQASAESEGSADSSPLSDLTFDVTEPQWEHFNLQKFPSYEIDWDSL